MADDDRIANACRNDTLDRCNVDELKKYLRSVGQYVSGNKSELIDRVKGAYKLGLGNVNDLQESDRSAFLRRENERLRTPIGGKMTHPSCIDSWSDDVSLIPDMTEKDIYNYFVYKLNTKCQLKSKVMYEDWHIHRVQVNNPDENESHCFVRCKAIPSMPSTNQKQCPDYDVWVMLSKMTGCINSAECSCTAGEGEGCNHIAALLYGIADITEKKKDGKLAPTSVKCKWNNPKKRKLTPKKSQDLTFQKVIHGKQSVIKKLSVPVFNIQKPVDVDKFKDKLLGMGANAGWLKNFEVKTDSILIPKLNEINFNFSDSVNLKDPKQTDFFNSYFKSMQITEFDCMTIECLTRSQGQSDLWALEREERLTASNFGRICKQKTQRNQILF
ncbi:uncharacterized protein LOC128244025 [Mya arenaria]|uniref:uncharacterized protein LOC128244025 n=1 Tax=Mya arenaria TaxID=6604 RepID=UPI0022E49218|nr:uncharacterized protein LOC128244025 [Mya arenaria]